MAAIVRVVLDIRTDDDPANIALMLIGDADSYGEVVAASGKRLEAGEPQTGSEERESS